MLKIKNSIFLIFVFCICMEFVPVGAADLNSGSLIPIEWQAIKLQENIEDKIKRSLLPVIKSEEYVIEVKIGVQADRAEDPSSKKITKNIQSKKVQFSVAEAPEDGDDFVVFNKIGLEAPIIGDEPVEITSSEVELTQKAMIEMNDRYNLFNYLETIDINLTFDKALDSKAKQSIQQIIKGLSFNTKDVIPQINTQYIELKVLKKAETKAPTAGASANQQKIQNPEKTSILDRFKNLDIMLGLILSALLIALAMIFIARKGSKVEEEGMLNNENKNEDEVVAENKELDSEEGKDESLEMSESPEGDDMSVDLTKTDQMTLKIIEGLDRFRKILNHHYNDMALLVKSWIKTGKGEEANALKGLVQLLNDTELSSIFKCLNIDERATWKMCLNTDLSKEELAKAYHFISSQIIQMMMVPSLIDDYEICDLLLALRAEDAAKFSEKNLELGVIFANVLSAKTIGEMFKLLPLDVSSEIIERSTYFKKEDVLAKMPILKTAMLEFKERRERPPFIKRIVDILPSAKPQLEQKLYATLLRHLSLEDVKNLALSVFPGALLSSLPETFFKEIVGKMTIENQVQYFAVLDNEERENALSRFATKGSKGREMIDLELATVLKNEVLLEKIKSERKEFIEIEFLNQVREQLNENPESQNSVMGMIEVWLQEIKELENDHANVRAFNREAA